MARLLKLSFYLFLISIPFGTRILIHQFTMGFQEYEAVFVYASDVFLILFLTIFLIYSLSLSKRYINVVPRLVLPRSGTNLFLLIFLVVAFISIFFAYSAGLAFYNFLRLFLLVLMAVAVGWLLREKILRINVILGIIVVLAVIQSGIGIGQFFLQSDLGLSWLGEPDLDIQTAGIAKLDIEGAKILRAYGTFPHPNVLAVFLLLGLLSSYYLFLINNSSKIRYSTLGHWMSNLLTAGIFILILGLILTFSRAAWTIAVLISLSIILYLLFSSFHRRRAISLLLILLAISALLLAAFYPYIFSRAQVSATEPAVVQRLAYNEMAVDLIKDRSLGVGIGNQVLYSVKTGLYEKFGMTEVWQWQPIHNFYLLVASEIGILGVISLICFLIIVLSRASKNYDYNHNNNDDLFKRVMVMVMLSSLLLFGLADHFPWTLQPGRLMLWLIIGILMGVNSARSTMDSAHPSEG